MTEYEKQYRWMDDTVKAQADALLVFLIRGDFARGQRITPVGSTFIGSFAQGQLRQPDSSGLPAVTILAG